MNNLLNEILFYGGLIVSGCSVIAAILHFFLSKLRFVKLNSQLTFEYGENKRKNK